MLCVLEKSSQILQFLITNSTHIITLWRRQHCSLHLNGTTVISAFVHCCKFKVDVLKKNKKKTLWHFELLLTCSKFLNSYCEDVVSQKMKVAQTKKRYIAMHWNIYCNLWHIWESCSYMVIYGCTCTSSYIWKYTAEQTKAELHYCTLKQSICMS